MTCLVTADRWASLLAQGVTFFRLAPAVSNMVISSTWPTAHFLGIHTQRLLNDAVQPNTQLFDDY